MIPNVKAILALAAAIFFLPLSAHAALTAKDVMDKAYGKYDEKRGCWIALDNLNNKLACLKVDHADTVATEHGKQLYVLAVGISINEEGEHVGVHAAPGWIGGFVAEEHDGELEIVSGSVKIKMGESGMAPSQWKFTKLGAADYRGWISTTEIDCHEGLCDSWYSILAPYGTAVRELTRLGASYDDAGACAKQDKQCKKKITSLKTRLEVDSSQITDNVFPLHILVTGQNKGAKLKPRTWVIPFDTKKWQYIEPPFGWPLPRAEERAH